MATIDLKPEEALVLIDFLLRFRDEEVLELHHDAEQYVLWDLCALLESQIPGLLDSHYSQLLESARTTISSNDWE